MINPLDILDPVNPLRASSRPIAQRSKKLQITFDGAASLDPVLTGGSNVVWTGPSGQVSTGTTPNPALAEAGTWTITMDDYSAVTVLSCVSDTVSAFTNLRVLTGITELRCENNSITVLDVSALTSLTYLRCYSNPLSALDVSALTNLTTLQCYGNSLTELDVTALTKLKVFYCYNNSLTTLDVSTLTSLTDFYCYNNSLTVLDVSALTSLTYLRCENNSITVLDVSALTSLNRLHCNDNSISVLDVSALTSLDRLECNDNASLNIDTITDDIDAIKGTLAAGLEVNMGGTCPAVSAGSETKILVMVAGPYNFTWTRNT